ncbi:uncharacterized protein BDR25DRAFT_306084 [Lindgomyces ingoldianus]|uniref:Uncharacterized protein n=1 Tax=Lindgomyces ingoldianus TaxID=673940 RepID=A0ACB6QHX7_9PLEO|nr:uncharacterized protein BDR25DRAFT_306084 [Lindgomyces ingoldianus]KAF2466588.1 hypothetical protein BDR25DRAFT_306084 [Lindgomyces ingoldianus]
MGSDPTTDQLLLIPHTSNQPLVSRSSDLGTMPVLNHNLQQNDYYYTEGGFPSARNINEQNGHRFNNARGGDEGYWKSFRAENGQVQQNGMTFEYSIGGDSGTWVDNTTGANGAQRNGHSYYHSSGGNDGEWEACKADGGRQHNGSEFYDSSGGNRGTWRNNEASGNARQLNGHVFSNKSKGGNNSRWVGGTG